MRVRQTSRKKISGLFNLEDKNVFRIGQDFGYGRLAFDIFCERFANLGQRNRVFRRALIKV